MSITLRSFNLELGITCPSNHKAYSEASFQELNSETENAIRLRLLTRPVLSSVKSNFMYQRISSDFISAAGSANADNEKIENPKPTSLSQLTKRSKKTKDVNSMLKKMLTDYGRYD